MTWMDEAFGNDTHNLVATRFLLMPCRTKGRAIKMRLYKPHDKRYRLTIHIYPHLWSPVSIEATVGSYRYLPHQHRN